MHTLNCDGMSLRYTTSGDVASPPLLFVHGWQSSHAVWRQTVPAFHDTHYCVALDLLGYGESDKPRDGDYNVVAQSRRVLALADALGLKQFVLCGHSMGGMVVLSIAASMAPERVTRVVNVSGTVYNPHPGTQWLLISLARLGAYLPVAYSALRFAARSRAFLRLSQYVVTHPATKAYAKEDLYDAVRPGVEMPAYRSLQSMARTDLRPVLPQIRCPVLTIFGKQDHVVPPRQGRVADKLVPDHRLLMLDKCGHLPMFERTAQYLAALRAFI